VSTAMIYTQVLKKDGKGVKSPMDGLLWGFMQVCIKRAWW
jgi:hypothetical protein